MTTKNTCWWWEEIHKYTILKYTMTTKNSCWWWEEIHKYATGRAIPRSSVWALEPTENVMLHYYLLKKYPYYINLQNHETQTSLCCDLRNSTWNIITSIPNNQGEVSLGGSPTINVTLPTTTTTNKRQHNNIQSSCEEFLCMVFSWFVDNVVSRWVDFVLWKN